MKNSIISIHFLPHYLPKFFKQSDCFIFFKKSCPRCQRKFENTNGYLSGLWSCVDSLSFRCDSCYPKFKKDFKLDFLLKHTGKLQRDCEGLQCEELIQKLNEKTSDRCYLCETDKAKKENYYKEICTDF